LSASAQWMGNLCSRASGPGSRSGRPIPDARTQNPELRTPMYRSRFRCHKNAVTSSDQKTTIYTNRANRHVIDRMLEVGKKRYDKTAHSEYVTHLEERGALQEQLSRMPLPDAGTTPPVDFFITRRKLGMRVTTLERQIQCYESGQSTKNWECMTRGLYHRTDHHVGILVLSNRIMGRPTESFFMDPDKCPSCIQLYRFDPITNVHTCTKCGYTVDVLFIAEDTSQDYLVTRDPNTGSSTPSKTSSEYHYIRSPLYRRYLGQFGDEVPTIPTEIMRVLYKYLSNIHLQNSVRCRPTPVGNILRTHGFPKWANFSIRITKLFNGEPIPVISTPMLDRLVLRFELIFQEATKQRQKLPSFEFITNILLRVEGRPDLANSFALHKTRTVLRRITTDLSKLILAIQKDPRSSELSWVKMPVF